jgi:Helix-turn-helix domain
MKIEAIHWILTAAPIPRQHRGASTFTVVLIGLANHAGTDGTNAFPSIAILTHYTRLSARSVQVSLRKLENLGLIALGHPGFVGGRWFYGSI